MSAPKLKDIANAIQKHLTRLEGRQEAARKLRTAAATHRGIAGLEGELEAVILRLGLTDLRLYHPSACDAGRYVSVRYVSYHGSTSLTKEEAIAYLAWLDAGGVGEHYKVPKNPGQLPALTPRG